MKSLGDEGVTQGQSSWDDDELERVEACLACHGRMLEPVYLGLADLLGGLPGEWGFVACSSCQALHLDPRPKIETIGRAYPADYITHVQADEANARRPPNLGWRLANDYLNSRFGAGLEPATDGGKWVVKLIWPLRQQLDYFFRHLPCSPGRILDVGCGNGAFLARAKRAGWDVEGIEPDPLAAASAAAAGLTVSPATIESFVPTQPYDRITLSHVFEHLHDPAGALTTCLEWLRPGGELWMSLPNPAGIGHRVFGRSWFPLDPPRHLFLPPPHVVVDMLTSAGYEDARLLRRGRGSRSSILPSSRYATGRFLLERQSVARLFSTMIDFAASLFPSLSEEIVVVARRGD